MSENKIDFKGMLHKAGYKATPRRLAVMRLMKQSRKPLSAQDIIERISGTADQATIYRMIRSFEKHGIIRPVDLRHNHAHYEFVDPTDHHHLVCTVCGRIEDVGGCDVDDMYKAIVSRTSHFAEVRQHALEFFGVCKACVKARKA